VDVRAHRLRRALRSGDDYGYLEVKLEGFSDRWQPASTVDERKLAAYFAKLADDACDNVVSGGCNCVPGVPVRRGPVGRHLSWHLGALLVHELTVNVRRVKRQTHMLLQRRGPRDS
jgi:hypothetical protein